MTDVSTDQFKDSPMLEAAERLAEAKLGCIVCNGTSAALGLETDRSLCVRVTQEAGVNAISTKLAYDSEIQERINFRGAPVAAGLERETGIPVLESAAVTAAHTMRVVGLDPRRVIGRGNVFADMSRLPAASPEDPANATISIS